LNGPKGIAFSRKDNSLYLADTENHAIRRIDLKTGTVTTVAGTGERGDGPEPDPRACRMSRPHGVFVGRDGTVYVGDSEAHRIRVIK
jgi:DNA-binding beta-propeller fold protein YncE